MEFSPYFFTIVKTRHVFRIYMLLTVHPTFLQGSSANSSTEGVEVQLPVLQRRLDHGPSAHSLRGEYRGT